MAPRLAVLWTVLLELELELALELALELVLELGLGMALGLVPTAAAAVVLLATTGWMSMRWPRLL